MKTSISIIRYQNRLAKRWLLVIAATALPLAINSQTPTPLSLTLSECREMALAHNEELQKADNNLRKAELDKAIALTSYLPSIDGSAVGAYIVEDIDIMGMKMQMKGTYMAGLSLTQPLYAGGKIIAGNKLARIGAECADETRRKTRMQVIADADNAYWTFLATTRKIAMLESYCRQIDTLYRTTEVSVQAQMATPNDLLRIKAKRSEINYQLQKARNGVNLCRLALCHIIGADLETPITAIDTVIAITPPLGLDADISQRPELILLQKQVEAQQQQIKMTRAEMLPTAGLSIGYTYYGNIKLQGITTDPTGNPIPYTQKFEDGFTVGMVSVSIPILHWGANFKKIKQSRLQLRNAELDLSQNRRLLSIEAQQARQNLSEGYAMIETADLGCQQARENLRVIQDRYRQHMSSLTDLLDAQSQWQQAESNLIEAQTQYKIYETEFRRTTGRLE